MKLFAHLSYPGLNRYDEQSFKLIKHLDDRVTSEFIILIGGGDEAFVKISMQT